MINKSLDLEREDGYLDELDLVLLGELEIDARSTFLEIAAKMGTSTTTVRRRLERLLNERLLAFATITDPTALGYLTRVEFGIKVALGEVESVAAKLIPYRNIQHLLATTGHHDMVAAVVIRNFGDLLSFVRRDLGKISGIRSIDIIMHLHQLKTDWPYLGNLNAESVHEVKFRDLDALDISLIGELEKDPRRAISTIAKDLGANRGVLGKRLQMLLDDRIIRIISIPNLLALGYKIWAIISVQVEPCAIESVAHQLKQYANVTHVVLVTGNFQIRASVVFRSRDDMYHFLGHDLGSILGIISHETTLHLKTYKRNLMLIAQEPYVTPMRSR